MLKLRSRKRMSCLYCFFHQMDLENLVRYRRVLIYIYFFSCTFRFYLTNKDFLIQEIPFWRFYLLDCYGSQRKRLCSVCHLIQCIAFHLILLLITANCFCICLKDPASDWLFPFLFRIFPWIQKFCIEFHQKLCSLIRCCP